MSKPPIPPPAISTLPEMLNDLERVDAELHAFVSEIDGQPASRTQLEATALDGFEHELSAYRERSTEFDAHCAHWSVLDAPRYARALEEFTARLRACTAMLGATERRLTQNKLEAERRTGWQGMDDPARQYPITKRYDHPVAHWALFAELLEGHVEDAKSLHAILEAARPRPHVLDDATLDRVEQQYTVMERETVAGYAWQFARWEGATLTAAQRVGLERTRGLLNDYEARSAQVLALVAELRTGAIDRVLAESDPELSINFH